MKRLFGLLIIAILLPVTTGNTQSVETSRNVTVTTPEASLAVPAFVQGVTSTVTPAAPVYWTQGEDHKEWNDALKALREADSESAKTDAKNKIEELLTAQYNESLDSYDKYLEELSEKIAEMKKQVEKRRAARDEMVQLKLLMVVSEAEGLGWPDQRPGFGLPPLRMHGGAGGGRLFDGPGFPAPGMHGVPGTPAPEMPPRPDRPPSAAR